MCVYTLVCYHTYEFGFLPVRNPKASIISLTRFIVDGPITAFVLHLPVSVLTFGVCAAVALEFHLLYLRLYICTFVSGSKQWLWALMFLLLCMCFRVLMCFK